MWLAASSKTTGECISFTSNSHCFQRCLELSCVYGDSGPDRCPFCSFCFHSCRRSPYKVTSMYEICGYVSYSADCPRDKPEKRMTGFSGTHLPLHRAGQRRLEMIGCCSTKRAKP